MRPLVGAVALVAAVGAIVLAVDVGQVHRSLEASDATYRLTPWAAREQPRTLLPDAFASRVLGIEDDLAYRSALRRLAELRTGERGSTSRDFAVLVTQAQRGMVEVSQTDPDPRLRSEATNVLGVFAVANPAGFSGFNPEFGSEAVGIFQNAVRVDPSNQEAKRNLEIVLRGLRRVLLPLPPEGQRGAPNQGAGAGIGRAGGGY